MTIENGAERGPPSSGDRNILSDVALVCREGMNLYSYIAAEVQTQKYRNLFYSMAEVRLRIAEELEAEIGFPKQPLNSSGDSGNQIRCWYLEARECFATYPVDELLLRLENIETKSLTLLRGSVPKVEDKDLAFRLASLVASFQIVHDRMKQFIDNH